MIDLIMNSNQELVLIILVTIITGLMYPKGDK